MAIKNVQHKDMRVRERIVLGLFWITIAVCATFLLGILTALVVIGTAELKEDRTESFYIASWVGVYCGTLLLLGVLALIGKPKALYAKKRYFAVAFVLLGVLGFYTLGFVGNKSLAITTKLNDINTQSKMQSKNEYQDTTEVPQENNARNDNQTNNSPPRQQSTPDNYRPPQDSTLCLPETLYYRSVYEKSADLDYGQSQVIPGQNGSGEVCYPPTGPVTHRIITPAVDERRIEGTRGAPTYSQPSPNYSRCQSFQGTGAYQACIDAVDREFYGN